MAQHNCPNCKKCGFSWHIDDDETRTVWGFHYCGYIAYEDESYRHACLCGSGGSVCRLEDEEGIYWWCARCDGTFLTVEGTVSVNHRRIR